MRGGWGEAAESLRNFRGRESTQFRGRFAAHPFRQPGTGGNRGHASPRLEAGFEHAPAFDAGGEAHHVPTSRIVHFHLGRGVRQVAGVARMLEVVQHRRIVKRAHGSSRSGVFQTNARASTCALYNLTIMQGGKASREQRARIVSLAPSATCILWAIGARRDVVGVTKWCAEVAPVGRLPRVGDCWAAEPGEIARLRPTLLIGSVPFKAEMVARLLELGVPLLAMNPRTLADVYADIRLLGRITGRAGAAERVVRGMQRSLAQIAGRANRPAGKSPRAERRPRVYCEAWPNPRISSPEWVAELVRIAGGEPSLAAGQKVTDEQVATAAPDVIVLAWTATGGRSDPQRALENPTWREVPAIRTGRVHAVHDELLNTPAPILIRGAHELLEILHRGRSKQRPYGVR